MPAPVMLFPTASVLSFMKPPTHNYLTAFAAKKQNPPGQHFWRGGIRGAFRISCLSARCIPPPRDGYNSYPAARNANSMEMTTVHNSVKSSVKELQGWYRSKSPYTSAKWGHVGCRLTETGIVQRSN